MGTERVTSVVTCPAAARTALTSSPQFSGFNSGSDVNQQPFPVPIHASFCTRRRRRNATTDPPRHDAIHTKGKGKKELYDIYIKKELNKHVISRGGVKSQTRLSVEGRLRMTSYHFATDNGSVTSLSRSPFWSRIVRSSFKKLTIPEKSRVITSEQQHARVLAHAANARASSGGASPSSPLDNFSHPPPPSLRPHNRIFHYGLFTF